MLDRIFKILDAQWLIHRDTALSYVPLFIAFLNGQKIDLVIGGEEKKIQVVGFKDREDEDINCVERWYDLEDDSIPDNSVAVIPVDGVLCSWDNQWIMRSIKAADNNPRINSLILLINSPGGMVSGIDIVTNTLKALSKPSISVISGMCASAAMWIASGTGYRISTSKMDMVGSIGTRMSIQDMTGLLDKIGIKITDFYATKATRKDEEIRAFLEKGDKEPMMAIVDFVNEMFHSAIQSNMGIAAESEVFTGAIFFAEKAKELGLINEVNTLEYAINYAYQLGLKNKINQFSTKLNFINS